MTADDDVFADLIGQWVTHLGLGHGFGEMILYTEDNLDDEDETDHFRVLFNGVAASRWDRLGTEPVHVANDSVLGQLERAERHGDTWTLAGGFGEVTLTAERVHRNDYHVSRTPPPVPTLAVEPPHACESMIRALADDEDGLEYMPAYREYGYAASDASLHPIEFCPFCGAALPPSLYDEWSERLAALGVDPEADEALPHMRDDVPPHMQDDRWWRGAGL